MKPAGLCAQRVNSKTALLVEDIVLPALEMPRKCIEFWSRDDVRSTRASNEQR